jgi:hypothetical protein
MRLGTLSRAKLRRRRSTWAAASPRANPRAKPAHASRLRPLFSVLLVAILVSASGCGSGSSQTQSSSTPPPPLGELLLSSSTVSLGDAVVGTPTAAVLMAQNIGSGSVTLTQILVAGSGFAVEGASLPAIIPPGGAIEFTFQFTPQSAGPTLGSATLISNAGNSPASVQLSGSGVSAPPHFVALSWAAAAGTANAYNVYRSANSGGPYALQTGSPIPGTAFIDYGVSGNTAYYYVVTTVAENGLESLPSQEVSTTTPGP